MPVLVALDEAMVAFMFIATARPPAWPRNCPARDTIPRAWHTPGIGEDGGHCRTPVQNTPKDELLTLQYRWHRLYGQQLSVVRLFTKRGLQICRCFEPERVGLPAVELPAWVFDQARCACMRAASSPSVDLHALRDLQQLLCERNSIQVGVAQASVQNGSQPKMGDTDADETQSAIQTAGSFSNDPDPASVGKDARVRPEGTPAATPGAAVQRSSSAAARAASERRRS